MNTFLSGKSKLIALVIVIYSLLVIFLQNNNNGFEPGHYGWVSSHVLSQIKKATPENGFLGFTYRYISEDGVEDIAYFDRYPFFYAGLFNTYLRLLNLNFSSEIYWSRIFMNVLYIITFIIGFFIAKFFFVDNIISIITVLLVFSGHDLIYYKDMVHFDQPGLIGFSLLLLTLLKEMSGTKMKWIYPVSIFAVTFGRGYPSFCLLLLWCFFEAYQLFREKKLKHFLTSTSLKVTALCIIISSSLLSYNIFQEAKIRNTSIMQTSIVVSAFNRLGVTKLSPEYEAKAAYHRVFAQQFKRVGKNLLPRVFVASSSLDETKPFILKISLYGLSGLIFVICAFFLRKYYVSYQHKKLIWLTLLSGFLWCIFMRKLTTFHEYTAMIYVPLLILLVGSTCKKLLEHLSPQRKMIALCASLVVAVFSLKSIQLYQNRNIEKYNAITEDMEQIRLTLNANEIKVIQTEPRMIDLFEGARYAPTYYLGDFVFDFSKKAKYLVSNKRIDEFESNNMVPNNKYFFLYKVSTN